MTRSRAQEASLRPADRAIVERDRALEALPLVLDEDLLAEAVGAPVRVQRVRYKPGRSAVASWRTTSGRSRFGEHGWVAVHDSPVKPAKALRAAARVGSLAALVPGTGGCAVVASVLADRALHRTVGRLQHHRPGLLEAATLLRHNPLRRQLWRTRTDDVDPASRTETVLRIDNVDVHRRHRLLDHLHRQGVPVHVPIGAPTSHSELVPWWGDGDLDARSNLPGAAENAWSAGRAVAGLHAASAMRLPRVTPSSSSSLAAALHPQTSGRVADAERRVRERVLDDETVLLHGDLSADQVLVGQDGDVRLIDLDRAATGPREHDLGSFVAAAHLAGHRDLLEPFLTGYADAGGRWDAGRLEVWTATALLSRIGEGFRRREANWERTWGSTLDLVEAVLDA